MKRWLALAVLPVVAAACGGQAEVKPTNAHIRLNRSIGGVSLGEPRAQVKATLGAGTTHASSHPYVDYYGGELSVFYGPSKQVIAMTTSSPLFHSPGGIRVGAPLGKLKSTAAVRCYGTGPKECQQGYAAVGKPGTTFGLDSEQNISYIRVATRG
jgi:hypothetical protein